MDWVYKAMLTATLVALLLSAAYFWGRRVAGLLTGLPTVTAPALVWLAIAHGPDFAAEAARGCVAAAFVCSAFAAAYALASRAGGPVTALCAGVAAASLSSTLWLGWRPALAVTAIVAVATGFACLAALRRLPQRALPESRRALRPGADVLITAAVSGGMSGAVSVLAHDVGAFWSGVMSSLPMIAAVVAVWLHVVDGGAAVDGFVRGYLVGLYGRTAFAVSFAVLVVVSGPAVAVLLSSAMLVALLGMAALHGRRRPNAASLPAPGPAPGA